jgi:hypothetical protein
MIAEHRGVTGSDIVTIMSRVIRNNDDADSALEAWIRLLSTII